MAGSEDDIPPPPLPSQTATQQTPHTISTIKLHILKKGEYDIWAMKMEHYLAHTDYPIWEVIQRGNGPKIILLNFTKMTDAKEMWEAIKSRFGGNDESKKMQKYILKQQFEAFIYDKTDVLTYHKKLLAEAEKEKEELKAKVEKWHNSSKSLNILLNSQMSARDKAGLGYGDQMNKGVLSFENEVFGSLFDSRSSDIEDSPVNNRYAEGMHAVPPPMTGIYIPSGPDKEIDDSQFTYGPKQSKPSESDARSSDFTSCESNSSEETHESMPESVVNEPKVVSQPKVWTDAPIIEEYESDSDDEHVSLPSKEQETPSFANTIKHVKTPRQTVKQQNTCSKSPKPDKKDCSGDCDFYEKRMAKQAEVNKRKCKGTGQRENRPVWNNVNRVNHQNQFVPTAVLTRTGKIQVNTARASSTNNVNTVRASSTKDVSTARHNFNSQAVPTNAARKVNTVKPIVNNVRPKTVFHKTYSPIRRPFNRTTTSRKKNSNQKVNTAEVKSVSAVGGKWETVVKPSAGTFWMSAKSKTINNVRYITAIVAGKPVTILEASIRSDLLFDDADGIDTLNNQAIFDTIQLMGKVLSLWSKNGKTSGNVTPLFDSMLVQPTEDEGEALERPSEYQPIPSPPHLSEDQPESQPDPSLRPSPSIPFLDSNPEGSGGNHRGQSYHVTIQAKKIKDLKAQIKKLKKKTRHVITHHKAWMQSVSMKTRLAGKKSMQKKWMQKESVSKQGRKTAKSKPTAHKDQAFDDPDDFGPIDYMETEDAHNEKGVSIEDQVNTVKPDEGTDKPKVSTDKIDEGTAELKNGNSDENATPTATPTVFGDDETIAEFLVSMSQNKAKQKGVEIKDAEDSNRPRPTSTRSLLTLKPLPKLILKIKARKFLRKKLSQMLNQKGLMKLKESLLKLANDEEIARKARIEADSILAARLQEEEREKFIIEERAKLLHNTIAAQRRFLAQQRAAEIRSRPPTRTQLRNQMMTYLKHVKRSDENFIAIGSAEDERRIKDMNKKATGIKKDDNIKEESKEEESTRKRKLGTRKKIKSRKRRFRQDTSQDDQTDSEKENDELRLCLTIVTDEDKEVDYEILNKKYPIIE
ncbi:hypothetical protein Tco_1327068 [Tanacetum coccineum]